MVGLFIVAIVLALFFSRPRRGLGAATRADAVRTPIDEVWMPGGDIFGREPAAPPPPEPPTEPTFPTLPETPEAPYDPWSTTADRSGQQPRWDRG